VINFTGLVLNVVLDYIMIFGKFGFPALGVAGAGYATALATWGSALVGLWMIAQSDLAKRFDFKFKMKLNPPLLKQFLKFGIPSGLQWALEGLAFTVFLIIMGRTAMGDAALSSSSIAVTVMMLTVLPSMGMAQAVLSQVGQALGSKNAEAAKLVTKDGIYLTLIYILIVASTFYLIPEFFLSWFKNDSNPALWNQVAQLTTQLLKIVAIFTILDSVYLNISFALKGAGDTRFVSIVALLVPWPIMVLPAYLLRNHSDAVILAWWFAALYSLTITAILSYRFIKGRWTQIDMIHSP
jgi:MATE family multidrug resistance protein